MAADPNFWQERWPRVIGAKEYVLKARTEYGPVAINDAGIIHACSAPILPDPDLRVLRPRRKALSTALPRSASAFSFDLAEQTCNDRWGNPPLLRQCMTD
nr:hypothetical protein [uncultured Sphingorhabdus sp.]